MRERRDELVRYAGDLPGRVAVAAAGSAFPADAERSGEVVAEDRLVALKRIFGDRLYVEIERVGDYDRLVEAMKTPGLNAREEAAVKAAQETKAFAEDCNCGPSTTRKMTGRLLLTCLISAEVVVRCEQGAIVALKELIEKIEARAESPAGR